MPEFGIIVSVDGDGEGRVLFGPFVCDNMGKWVRKECVTKVESVSDGTMVWSSEANANVCVSGSKHGLDEDEDLCSRMDMLSTFDGAEEQSMVCSGLSVGIF
ncbi:hypothetical protein TSMEX_005532 [Taenia solium]|eukprot:TsM_000989800 transcript=TsM_000989800 gene=TsM_000989800